MLLNKKQKKETKRDEKRRKETKRDERSALFDKKTYDKKT